MQAHAVAVRPRIPTMSGRGSAGIFTARPSPRPEGYRDKPDFCGNRLVESLPKTLVCAFERSHACRNTAHPPLSDIIPPDCLADFFRRPPLDNETRQIKLHFGDYYIDGPIFLKSGVFIDGDWKDEYPTFCWLVLYDGDSNTVTGEDAMVVVDGVTGGEVCWCCEGAVGLHGTAVVVPIYRGKSRSPRDWLP